MIETRRHTAMGKLSQYFRNDALMSNFLLKALLAFVVGQQIYMPQKHDYFHLALLFMFMIFIDIYEESTREISPELSFMGLILGASVVTILEHVFSLNLELLYFGLTIGATAIAMQVLWQIIGVIKDPGQRQLIAERNQKIFSRKTTFVVGILYSLEAIMAIAIGYTLYLAVLSLL